MRSTLLTHFFSGGLRLILTIQRKCIIFWCLSDLLTTKFQEFQEILKIHFKTILDLCCFKFWDSLHEHRPRFKSQTCSKKMIKLNNFSKIEIFKFGSDFQVKIHQKSNQIQKIFRCRSACRCRSRLGLVKNSFDSRRKKWLEWKIENLEFLKYFSNFWIKKCLSDRITLLIHFF